MKSKPPKFQIGQIVRHLRFDYRGVVIDCDLTFQQSEQWYEEVAQSRPPKDAPWYRVLVHESDHQTYVAERHLMADDSPAPVEHPEVFAHFDGYRDGHYVRDRNLN
ncbi:MAG: heat shock protein HspQ [Myxococcota bacterium]